MGGMRELIKRGRFAGPLSTAGLALDAVLDPNWLRVWLVAYGGSLSILATYLMSAVATMRFKRAE